MRLFQLFVVVLGALALGYGAKQILAAYGENAISLIALAILIVGVSHQIWHKHRYGRWY